MEKDLSLSEYYDIPLEKFAELGVLNPNLGKNTNHNKEDMGNVYIT